jgi:hypothetical protein
MTLTQKLQDRTAIVEEEVARHQELKNKLGVALKRRARTADLLLNIKLSGHLSPQR